MLAEAVNWDEARPRVSTADVLDRAELAHYVEGWPRAGEFGFVATHGSTACAGAAWCRYLPADDAGYGFVDELTPEVTVAVARSRRGEGIGTALLLALIDEADARAIPALSLSVEKANPAVRLYGRVGFDVVRVDGGAWTMRIELTGARPDH
jgi:ribosomal protein S18 acetylase RimI-like enzyme